MFGISFPEFLVLGTVALLVLGPDKLPGMLKTLGQWLAKLRKLTTEVRYQSGIDDVLRSEGLDGGLHELRSLMRGGLSGSVLGHSVAQPPPQRSNNVDHFAPDKSREYPVEGADAYGALPEDLLPGAAPAVVATPPQLATPPLVTPEPVTPELVTPELPTSETTPGAAATPGNTP